MAVFFHWIPDIRCAVPIGCFLSCSCCWLTQQIADQRAENERLLERNRVLDAEVLELKKGTETVEERARHELGMVKEGETLYQLAQ
jgi:cell division protein FtsB